MNQQEEQNRLIQFRKRMRFTQTQVIRLLGWRNLKDLYRIEMGQSLPSLLTAIKLGIIYRVQLEYLFQPLYEQLRKELRERESAVLAGQQCLPLNESL